VKLTLFWDAQGYSFGTVQRGDTTANSVHCSEMLWYELKPAAGIKRQGLLLKDVTVFHDNVHPHTATYTIESLQQLNFEVLKHHLCSPSVTFWVHSEML
jgi:hypothetical protein